MLEDSSTYGGSDQKLRDQYGFSDVATRRLRRIYHAGRGQGGQGYLVEQMRNQPDTTG